MNTKKQIVFRKEDEWLVECVAKIVAAKQGMKLDTSFSFELVRLAKAGLVLNLEGRSPKEEREAAMDRVILAKGVVDGASEKSSGGV